MAAVIAIGIGGGLVCTRPWAKSNQPSATIGHTPSPSASAVSPSPSGSEVKEVVADFSEEGVAELVKLCTPASTTHYGSELAGSRIEKAAVLYGNLDQTATARAATSTKLSVPTGEYLVVVVVTNGNPTQVGLGITLAGAPVNKGSADAVDPIGQGGVSLAAFGEADGWSKWQILNAAEKFKPTGREISGYRSQNRFVALVPWSELGSDANSASMLIETFVRDTPVGLRPSDSDPKGASKLIISTLARISRSPEKRELLLVVTPRVVSGA
ncbi:MAG: hypothetical protein DCC49_09445 [Acidobacteria bacterium]|nr:MAG: hypothetical protein DCC49_09445 [Acidobacteriota bacterium]